MQGPDDQPIPPAAQQQIQTLTALNKQLIQSVQALTKTIDQKQLELESRERISAGDRAARMAISADTNRTTLAAATLRFGESALSNHLDASMQAIENMQDHIETSAQMDLDRRLQQEDQQHQRDMQAAQAAQQPQGQPGQQPQPVQ